MSKPDPAPKHGKLTPVLLIIILTITFFAFLPSLSNQFINTWDDNVYVTENPLITHLNWHSIRVFFTNQVNGTYVPVPLLTWAVEYKIFGLDPFYYHLDNLLIHLLCTSLVFWFFILLRLPLIYAASGALLFGIHPMHVESVAWITERKDLVFCLFYLGSLIGYIKFILSKNRKPFYFLLALLLFVFSLFSKIQAVSLPLVLILFDYWFGRPLKWNLLWEKIPFLACSLGFGLSGYFILQRLGAIQFSDPYTLTERILFGFYSLSVYLVRLIAPLYLSAVYPYPVSPGQTMPVLYFLNPVLLVGVGILTFLTTRKTKAVAFGALFFLFNVMFLLQVVRAGQAYQADRFTYISYIGLFFIAVWYAGRLANRNKTVRLAMIGLALAVTAFFFSNTYARCRDWKDSLTIWNDVIEKFPEKIPIAYYNRGVSNRNLGQWDQAIDDYSMAVWLDPKYTHAFLNRGVAYANLKQLDKAIADYSEAIAVDPEYTVAFSNRGVAFRELGQTDKAIADFIRAIEIDPGYKDAYLNRGVAFRDLGQWDKAIADYSIAIKIDPDYGLAWFNRGVAWATLGKWDNAITDCSRVTGIEPDFPDAYLIRGVAYANLGQWDRSIADYSRTIEIDPGNYTAYSNRGSAYGSLGQWEKAIDDCSVAIRIRPDYAKAWYNRGIAFGNQGQWDKAISDYSRVIELDPGYTVAQYNREDAYRKLHSEKRR